MRFPVVASLTLLTFHQQLLGQKIPVIAWDNVSFVRGTDSKCVVLNSRDDLLERLERESHIKSTGPNKKHEVQSGPLPSVDWHRNTVLLVTADEATLRPKTTEPDSNGKSLVVSFDKSNGTQNSGVFVLQLDGKYSRLKKCTFKMGDDYGTSSATERRNTVGELPSSNSKSSSRTVLGVDPETKQSPSRSTTMPLPPSNSSGVRPY